MRDDVFEKLVRDGAAVFDRLARDHDGAFPNLIQADVRGARETLRDLRPRCRTFLELGSGLGIITIVADLLGYDAYGIEIEPRLVDESLRLAESCGSGATFVTGSFVPPDFQENVEHLNAVGPAGYDDDYNGFDLLVVINLAGESLADPRFGAGSIATPIDLMVRGTVNHPTFGGAGPIVLGTLASDAVWATLVPDDIEAFSASADGVEEAVAMLLAGEVFYLANACPADIDGSGAVDFGDILAILGAWGNVGGPEDLDASGTVDFGDLLVVLGAWGPCV